MIETGLASCLELSHKGSRLQPCLGDSETLPTQLEDIIPQLCAVSAEGSTRV